MLTPEILSVWVDGDLLVLAGQAEEGTDLELEASGDMDVWAPVDQLMVTALESYRFRPAMASGRLFRLRY